MNKYEKLEVIIDELDIDDLIISVESKVLFKGEVKELASILNQLKEIKLDKPIQFKKEQ